MTIDQLEARDVTFEDVAAVDWDAVPVTGEGHQHARDIAGRARDFRQFYVSENRGVALAVERWLMRYSAAHTWRG